MPRKSSTSGKKASGVVRRTERQANASAKKSGNAKGGDAVMRAYKERYQDSGREPGPHTSVCCFVICAESDDEAENEEGWSTLAELQREGKVRWIGVSNWSVDQMRRAQRIAPITSLNWSMPLLCRCAKIAMSRCVKVDC